MNKTNGISTKKTTSWHSAPNKPTQSEKNEAHSRGININHYGYARDFGATHNEVLDAHQKGIDVKYYGYIRNSGANHNEALDAHQKGIDVKYYGYAKDCGANHNEVLDAHSKGIYLNDYGYARNSGATHNEALDANQKGINISDYGYARHYGANHNEILDAHQKGINISDYAYERFKNNTHSETLKKLIPNYNPYNDIDWKTSSKENFNLKANIADWYGNGNTVMPVEKINKIAGYDKITNEWEPELWEENYGLSYYPKPTGLTYDEEWNEPSPHPELGTTNIGRGHLFSAMLDHSTPYKEAHYMIYGKSKTKEAAAEEMGRYADIHNKGFGIYKPDDWGGKYEAESYRHIKEIKDNKGQTIGYNWAQTHVIPEKLMDGLTIHGARQEIEFAHKNVYDANKQNKKIAKVYEFDQNGNIKVSDRMSPEELGPEFSGVDAPDQTVGEDINNQPEGISATIPGNSFLNHDTLSYRKYAEIEDTNYEGVGSVFGEGMGPQDLSDNVTDVEEGPKGPKSTERSTTQLPASLQGQAVLPDVTSWFTSSKSDDHKYDSYTEDDDSDDDDEDDYDDNYSW